LWHELAILAASNAPETPQQNVPQGDHWLNWNYPKHPSCRRLDKLERAQIVLNRSQPG